MSKRLSITRVFQRVVKSANAVFGDEKPLIAVMGATGAGKSRFIKLATGVEVVESASLESCTSEIEEVTVKINGKKVTLIDTPGFDDTNKSDTEILTLITNYLESNYRKDRRLTGIIFLHRITDNRMTGVSARSILMFEKLIGKAALDHVILCTTMWDLKEEQEGELASREEQLKSKFWANMIEAGARTARHSNTPQSAREIVSKLINLKSTVLRIQKEMVDERKSLSQTSAGIEGSKEVARLEETQRKEMQRMREAEEKARAADAARMMEMLSQQRMENERRLREEAQARAWHEAERKRELQELRERAKEVARNQMPAIGITRAIAYNPNDDEHWGRTVEYDSEGDCVTDAWVQLISQGTRRHRPVYYSAHRGFDTPYPENIGITSMDVFKYTGDAFKPAFVTTTGGYYHDGFTKLGTVSADMSGRRDQLRRVQDYYGHTWWCLDYKVYLSLEWGTLKAWIEWQDQGRYLRTPQTTFSVDDDFDFSS